MLVTCCAVCCYGMMIRPDGVKKLDMRYLDIRGIPLSLQAKRAVYGCLAAQTMDIPIKVACAQVKIVL